jgi:hypothetical protein
MWFSVVSGMTVSLGRMKLANLVDFLVAGTPRGGDYCNRSRVNCNGDAVVPMHKNLG